jgi:hypothetical protein
VFFFVLFLTVRAWSPQSQHSVCRTYRFALRNFAARTLFRNIRMPKSGDWLYKQIYCQTFFTVRASKTVHFKATAPFLTGLVSTRWDENIKVGHLRPGKRHPDPNQENCPSTAVLIKCVHENNNHKNLYSSFDCPLLFNRQPSYYLKTEFLN